ncbi:MAG TPA: hypothetical protein VFA50_20215 [Stellaceae bacterium]|nr:hypothetical protein [Stellaceae bacterium]
MAFAGIVLAAAMTLSPAPKSHLEALSIWSDAYRNCYEPAHFSLAIDARLTVRCIREALRAARTGASPDLRASLDGLIDETPNLVDSLNARVPEGTVPTDP